MNNWNGANKRIIKIYYGMKTRCTNPNRECYKDYGGRGIKVCDEWLGEQGIRNFYEWSIENGYSDELTIDRIDNNGDYSPENCRWVSLKVQAHNKRNSVHATYKNEEKPLIDIAEVSGLNYRTLHSRITKGESTDDVINNPHFVREVAKIDFYTGDVIEVYSSANEAAKRNQLASGNIVRCCNGKANESGGFGWMFVDELDSNRYINRTFKQKINSEGRFALPKYFRDKAGLKDGDYILITCIDKSIVITKYEGDVD